MNEVERIMHEERELTKKARRFAFVCAITFLVVMIIVYSIVDGGTFKENGTKRVDVKETNIVKNEVVVEESCVHVGMNYDEYFECTGINISEMSFTTKPEAVYRRYIGSPMGGGGTTYWKWEGEKRTKVTKDEYLENVK